MNSSFHQTGRIHLVHYLAYAIVMASTIVSLARLQLPFASRLLPSSWCPDKDLLVVIPRVGSKDRLSLWNMQGSKKWEVEVDSDNTAKNTIVDIAWSPDGMFSFGREFAI